jgi:hypothetical protein
MSALSKVLAPLLVCGVLGVATRDLRPPRPVPADAPNAEFSAERALGELRTIAAKPHPMGSEEHDRVRDYLAATFTGLGLDVTFQDGVVERRPRSDGAGAHVAFVRNVVARLCGTASSGRDVVLAAHYDSVPTGPGAGDDGAAVAALLEVARVLALEPRRANDIVFLITDGEEVGLYGAKLAVRDPTFLERTALVLNFEARGHRGPAVMFQTFGAVKPWVDAMARVRDPVTVSLAADVYERMPNDTDLSVFGRAGLFGMNFAFIGGHSHYHTPLDSIDELDHGSLQHHGQYALDLARHFGGADLDAIGIGPRDRAADEVYFSLGRLGVVHWPAHVSPMIAYGVLGLAALTLVLAIARRRTCLGSFALDGLAVVLALVAPAASWWIGQRFSADGSAPFSPAAAMHAPQRILLSGMLLCTAVVVWILRWRARGVLPLAVAMGWSVGGVLALRVSPAAAMLSFAAAPVILVELLRVVRARPDADGSPTWFDVVAAAVAAFFVVATFAPLCLLLPTAIGPGMNGPAIALAMLVVLACARAWPRFVTRHAGRVCAVALVVACVIGAPLLRASFDERWPRPVPPHVVTRATGFTSTIVRDDVEQDMRTVVVRLVPPVGTWRSRCTVSGGSNGAPAAIRAARIGSFEVRDVTAFALDGRPPEGFDLELRAPVGSPLTIEAFAVVPTVGAANAPTAPHPPGEFAAPNQPDAIEVKQSIDV